MGYPRSGFNAGVFDKADDAREVLRARIPAGQNGEFTPVEVWIVEGHLTREQPYEDQPAPIGWVFKRAHHRLRISGGVKNHRRQIARGNLLERFERVIDGGV